MAIYRSKSPRSAHESYSPKDIQDLQRWRDKANEAAMMLQSNVDVVTALKNYYAGLSTDEKFPLRQDCQRNIVAFAADIDKITSWLRTQILRVKLLADIIADRKELVSFR